jgi:hypothetical protein
MAWTQLGGSPANVAAAFLAAGCFLAVRAFFLVMAVVGCESGWPPATERGLGPVMTGRGVKTEAARFRVAFLGTSSSARKGVPPALAARVRILVRNSTNCDRALLGSRRERRWCLTAP